MANITDPQIIYKIVLQHLQGDKKESVCKQYDINEGQLDLWMNQFQSTGWRVFSHDFMRPQVTVREEPKEKGSEEVFLRRVKKMHGGHHGGSWKVAYADFVTAMMAFFLLMWLVNAVPQETKAALSEYFEDPEKFMAAGGSQEARAKAVLTPQTEGVLVKDAILGNAAPVKGDPNIKMMSKARISALAENIRKDVREKFEDLSGQLMMEPVADGLKIQMVDNTNFALFDPGGHRLNAKGMEMVRMLAENLKGMSNKIAIEGHTDSSAYKGESSRNWDLSVLRALEAKKAFEKFGVDISQFARVVGFADNQLFNPSDPRDPMNRRISIVVLE